MRALILMAALVAAPAAMAQSVTLPSLFEVTGITDLLNVRAGPDTAQSIVGGLSADARDIEVVALDPSGDWGLVNTGEQVGWVALRFLAEQPGVWEPGTLPANLSCFGTEPFWSLRPEAGTLVYDTPEGGAQSFPLTVLDSGIPGDARRALVAGEGGPVATITPRVCSDGMSDRAFGLETLVILARDEGPQLRTGCCSIAPSR